jgi:Reverse transcriptase (RNA-dependent DNA polymerase)
MQGKCPDYQKLHDPFKDKEDNDMIYYCANVIKLDANPLTLKEAKALLLWPKWEKAINAKLQQLSHMGTWKLVERSENTIPIANKWVFAKKRDKSGNIIKYKARLIAKGCAQRLGYDYNETHSPVIHLEMIQAILAMVPCQKFKVQQMDIKGAYLNRTLKERVYMQQPEGYNDDSGQICLLIKTLYGLKQSSHEWNIELDTKLQKCRYK